MGKENCSDKNPHIYIYITAEENFLLSLNYIGTMCILLELFEAYDKSYIVLSPDIGHFNLMILLPSQVLTVFLMCTSQLLGCACTLN